MRCERRGVKATDVDRSCGFLTKTERECLLGEWRPNGEEATNHQLRQKRYDIQIRARHALADLALLQEYGDADLKDGIVDFDEDAPVFDEDTLDDASAGLVRLAAELLLGVQTSAKIFEATQSSVAPSELLPELKETMSEEDFERADRILSEGFGELASLEQGEK